MSFQLFFFLELTQFNLELTQKL